MTQFTRPATGSSAPPSPPPAGASAAVALPPAALSVAPTFALPPTPTPATAAGPASSPSSSSSTRSHRDYPGIVCNACRQCSSELARRGGSASPLLLARCSGCRAVYYCSKRCQKTDWPQHKQLCRQVRLMHEKQQGIAKLGSHRQADTAQQAAEAAPVAEGDEVFLHYTAKLANGAVFDRSFAPPHAHPVAAATQSPVLHTAYSLTYLHIPPPPHTLHCQPSTRPAVIAGLSIALLSFKRGECAQLLVTAPYAWGEAGISGLVPPKSTVVIDVHCIGWVSAKERASRAQSGWQRCMADPCWQPEQMDAAIDSIIQHHERSSDDTQSTMAY